MYRCGIYTKFLRDKRHSQTSSALMLTLAVLANLLIQTLAASDLNKMVPL